MSEKSRRDIEREIVTRTMKDVEFRQSLLADPVGVLEHETGLTVPQGVEIRVVQESPTVIYLVLPEAPEAGRDVSKEALAAAVGQWVGPSRSWMGDCFTDSGYWSCCGRNCTPRET